MARLMSVAMTTTAVIPLRNADLRAAWERAVDDGQGDLFDGAALGLDCSAGVCFT